MPNKSFILDNIQIPRPCTTDWDSMIGNDEVRFCEHCAKDVHNLSSMTIAQAEKLVVDSNGKLCIRYKRLGDGTIRTVEKSRPLFELTRKVSRIAAGAVAVALSVSNSVTAKPAASKQVVSSAKEKKKSDVVDEFATQDTNILAGVVTGEKNDGISGAAITLRGKTTGYQYTAASASFGVFCIDDLPVEPYEISVTTPNFKTLKINNIDLSAHPVTKVSLRMSPGDPSEEVVLDLPQITMTLGGAMGMEISIEIPGINYKALKKFESDKISARKLNDLTRILALQKAVAANKKEHVESLLAVGVELNGRDEQDEKTGKPYTLMAPVLFSITSDTSGEIVADLIRAGADINLKDSQGQPAIINAAQVSNKDALQELIRYGANVDEQNQYGWTALSLSAASDNIDSVRMLIDSGADVNHKDMSGYTALIQILLSDWQQSARTRDIIRLLKQQGATE